MRFREAVGRREDDGVDQAHTMTRIVRTTGLWASLGEFATELLKSQ